MFGVLPTTLLFLHLRVLLLLAPTPNLVTMEAESEAIHLNALTLAPTLVTQPTRLVTRIHAWKTHTTLLVMLILPRLLPLAPPTTVEDMMLSHPQAIHTQSQHADLIDTALDLRLVRLRMFLVK